jgi:hypothetical protein
MPPGCAASVSRSPAGMYKGAGLLGFPSGCTWCFFSFSSRRLSFSTTGMTKASVLPEPVHASTATSCRMARERASAQSATELCHCKLQRGVAADVIGLAGVLREGGRGATRGTHARLLHAEKAAPTLLPQNSGIVASWTGVAFSNLSLSSTSSVSAERQAISANRSGPEPGAIAGSLAG